MSRYKPYPDYKPSELDELPWLPAGWQEKPLCRIISHNDNVIAEDTDPELRIRYVDISSVNFSSGITKAEEMRFADAPSRARRLAKTGDIVISTVRTYLKAVAEVTDEYADCVYSTGFAVLRTRNEELLSSFMKWAALNELFVQSVEAHSEGLSYPAINASELVKLKIPVPPVADQAAISKVLDAETSRIDALISKKSRFIELLKEKRRALIADSVTKGLDPNVKMKESGTEWIGEVPRTWRVCNLAYVTKISAGGTPDRKIDKYWGGEIPWIKTGEVDYNLILASEEAITKEGLDSCSAYVAQPGTILMAMYGMGITRGRVAILGIAAAFNQACAAIACSGVIENRYLFYALTAAYAYIRDLGNEASQINLNMEIIGKLKIPVPPQSEQRKIADELDKSLSETMRLEELVSRSLQLLQERRRALITSAVTGQIDLRGAA